MDEERGKRNPAHKKGQGMKRIAGEGKPVVVVPVVLEPIEIGLALRIVPPDIANL